MPDEIRVLLDEELTRKAGGAREGKVHTRYYSCWRGEPFAPDELGVYLAVPLIKAESARYLTGRTVEERADELARLGAEQAFHRHDRSEDA